MKSWPRFCLVAGYLWLMVAIIVFLALTIVTWMDEGYDGLHKLLSPFESINYIVIIAAIAPGIGLIMLSEKLQTRQ